MILLIDNYDSFSYNLYQMIGEIKPDIKVIKNDEMTAGEISALAPEKIVISPGPGRPCDAGMIIQAAKTVCRQIPTLGVCLGHQAICEAYGAKISYAKQLMHGKQSRIGIIADSPLFSGIGRSMLAARYHSLAAKKDTIPDCLQITAVTDDGEIMAVQHKEHKIYGVQFHPESIMTPEGGRMMRNFIEIARKGRE